MCLLFGEEMKRIITLVVIFTTISIPISSADTQPPKLCTTYKIDVWNFDHSVISWPDGTYTNNSDGVVLPNKATLTCLAWIPDTRPPAPKKICVIHRVDVWQNIKRTTTLSNGKKVIEKLLPNKAVSICLKWKTK